MIIFTKIDFLAENLSNDFLQGFIFTQPWKLPMPIKGKALLILQKIPCIVSWRWFKLTGWVLLQYLHPESRYDGEDMSLISIYNKNKKRRGKSKYLLSVMVDVVKDGDIISYLIAYSFFISSRLNSVEGRLVITHS